MVFWVFGYGSLLWKAGFDYDEKVVGFVKNYRRAFHLGCTLHRGTPDLPARVATLEPHEGAVCWGVAYGIHRDERARAIIAYLEGRECEYDLHARVDFYTADSPAKSVLSQILAFTATPEEVNKYYLGPSQIQEIAIQIATAEGPCGYNYEYLFRLEKALSDIGHDEDEVTELANQVRSLLIAGIDVESAVPTPGQLCENNRPVQAPTTKNLSPAEYSGLLSEKKTMNGNPLDRMIEVSSAA